MFPLALIARCFFSLYSRVHISEKTLSFLHGEFEVEPAFGEKREEALRIAGLKTFFITKVLKPVSSRVNIARDKLIFVACVSGPRTFSRSMSSSLHYFSCLSEEKAKAEGKKCLFIDVCLRSTSESLLPSLFPPPSSRSSNPLKV
jgi:hypothetical protein